MAVLPAVEDVPSDGPYREQADPRRGVCFVTTHPPLPNAVVWVGDPRAPLDDDNGWRGYTDSAGTIELHTTLRKGDEALVHCRRLGWLPMKICLSMSAHGLTVTLAPQRDWLIT